MWIGLTAMAGVIVAAAPATIVLPRGTPLRLMVIDEVTTKTARVGDRFKLRLDQPVMMDGTQAIGAGAWAIGEVIAAAESGIAGRSGKLATRLIDIEVGGVRIPLDGAPASAGKGGNTQIIIATLALTPWGLFARGNNAKLKAGEIVTGVTLADYTVPMPPAPAVAPSPGS